MARKCECWYHRYHVVHTLPGDERVYDHSQGTWNGDLRGRQDVESYPSELYEHGMTASQLRAKEMVGLLGAIDRMPPRSEVRP